MVTGFFGYTICLFLIATCVPIDIQPTNSALTKPPTSAPVELAQGHNIPKVKIPRSVPAVIPARLPDV